MFRPTRVSSAGRGGRYSLGSSNDAQKTLTIPARCTDNYLPVEIFFELRDRIGMHGRIHNSTPTKRRLHRQARSAEQLGQALALRRDGATYAAIGQTLGVCLERARRITLKAERLANAPRWYDGLPARAINLLHQRGLNTLSEIDAARAVAQFTRRELMNTPNFGRGSLSALRAWLAKHGLALRPP